MVGHIAQLKKLASDKNQISLDKSSLATIHEFAQKHEEDPNSEIKCVSLIVDTESGFLNKSLEQAELGKRGNCFVVGIERNNNYIINPTASTVFQVEDMVWILGNEKSIYAVLKENFYF